MYDVSGSIIGAAYVKNVHKTIVVYKYYLVMKGQFKI